MRDHHARPASHGIDRQVPGNIEAERALLGSCLLDRDAIASVAPIVAVGDFYLEKHRWVYEAMLDCFNKRVPPDLQTVYNALRGANRIAELGDMPFLVDLTNLVPTAYHVAYYAQIIARCAVLRELIAAAGRIAMLGYDADGTDDDILTILANAQAELQRLSRPGDQSGLHTLADAYDEIYKELQDDTPPGTASGLHGYDFLTGGWHQGDLNILAGPTGGGKTRLSLQFAINLCLQQGERVHYLTREMGYLQLAKRILAQQANVDSLKFRKGGWTSDELQRISDAMGTTYERAKLLVIDEGLDGTVEALRARAINQAMAIGAPPTLIVSDYLQIQEGPANMRNMNREQEIAAIARGLKNLARELNCAVLALSQINDNNEKRKDNRPVLSDLRESRGVGHAADLAMFVYEDTRIVEDDLVFGPTVLEIVKHRHGPLGRIPLVVDAEHHRVRDAARPGDPLPPAPRMAPQRPTAADPGGYVTPDGS